MQYMKTKEPDNEKSHQNFYDNRKRSNVNSLQKRALQRLN